MVQPLRIGSALTLFLIAGTSRLSLEQAHAGSSSSALSDENDWARTTLDRFLSKNGSASSSWFDSEWSYYATTPSTCASATQFTNIM